MSINSRNGNTLLESGFFPPVRAATVAPIALTGLQTIDTVVLAAGDRVLVKDQTDQTTNGIYAASDGAWVRTSDAASNSDFFSGMAVVSALGAANAGQFFICTCADDPVVVGTSEITFASQSGVMNALQSATSASSLPLAIGAMNFATQAGKVFSAKQYVLAFSLANPDNCALCKIGSYVLGTLNTTCVSIGGAGTVDDWQIVLANSPASAGRVPPLGTGNVVGPGAAVAGNLPKFGDNTGKALTDSGVLAGTLAGRNQLLAGDAGTSSIQAAALQPGAAPLPYVAAQSSDNLHLSNDATNPTRDVDVSAGRVRDDGDTTNLQLAATIIKRLDQAWAAGGAAGAPAGACDAGVKGASQTWHLYLIGKLGIAVTSWSRTTNVVTLVAAGHGLGLGGTIRVQGVDASVDGVYPIVVVTDANHVAFAKAGADVGATPIAATLDGFDVLTSQSYPAPTMPAGWTAKQCLGSVVTDGAGNVAAFTQAGDEFVLGAAPAGFAAAAGLTTLVEFPLGVNLTAKIRAWQAGGGALVAGLISSPYERDDAPAITGPSNIFSAVGSDSATDVWVLTNTSAQIRTRSSGAAITIFVVGWRDPRRRLF